MIRTLEELINTIGEKLKPSLCHKYGLLSYEHLENNKDIAKKIGLSSGTVSNHLKVALRRLKHISRAKYFCLMPDNLLEDVFGTTDVEEIFYNINLITPALSDFKKESREMWKGYLSNSKEYINKVDLNYSKFCEILQGSEFYKYLSAIDKLADKIGLQGKNLNETFDRINRFTIEKNKINGNELLNIFDSFQDKLLKLEYILERFEQTTII